MAKKKYSTSSELMEAVRKLDYKRFYESFELIDPDGLEYMVELHWSINDMDNALYETDSYTPMEFFEIAEKFAPVI